MDFREISESGAGQERIPAYLREATIHVQQAKIDFQQSGYTKEPAFSSAGRQSGRTRENGWINSEKEMIEQHERFLVEYYQRDASRYNAAMSRKLQIGRRGVMKLTGIEHAALSSFQKLTAGMLESWGYMLGQMASGVEFSPENFLSQFLKMMGTFAIELGGAILAIGIAEVALLESLKSLNGYAAIAAGAALIVAGGALHGVASTLGDRAGALGSGASEPGGYSPRSNPDEAVSPVSPYPIDQGQTVITLNFNGVVGDAKGAAREIVGLINGAAGSTAQKIVRRAVAGG